MASTRSFFAAREARIAAEFSGQPEDDCDPAFEPIIRAIAGGYSAHARRWAVHGVTPGDAMQKFREAQAMYREIRARPDPHRR